MPYAPSVNDQSGQIMGAGILGAFQNISRGMEAYKQRQEENKALDSENKALELLTKSQAGTVGLPPEMVDQLTLSSPDESPRAKNARLKTALHGVLTQQQLQDEQQRQAQVRMQMVTQQQQQALTQAQIGELQRKQAGDARNAAAAAGAVMPQTALPAAADVGRAFNTPGATVPQSALQEPTGDEMMRRYIAAGGNDNNQAQMLIAAAKPRAEAFNPSMVDMGDGVKAMMTSPKSAVPVIKPVPEKTAPLSGPGKLLADAKTLETQGDKESASLLRQIAAKQGEDKPMTLTDYLISGGRAEDFRSYVEGFKASGKTPAAATSVALPKFNASFEGKKVRGPDGKVYLIKNGVPVPQ